MNRKAVLKKEVKIVLKNLSDYDNSSCLKTIDGKGRTLKNVGETQAFAFKQERDARNTDSRCSVPGNLPYGCQISGRYSVAVDSRQPDNSPQDKRGIPKHVHISGTKLFPAREEKVMTFKELIDHVSEPATIFPLQNQGNDAGSPVAESMAGVCNEIAKHLHSTTD